MAKLVWVRFSVRTKKDRQKAKFLSKTQDADGLPGLRRNLPFWVGFGKHNQEDENSVPAVDADFG